MRNGSIFILLIPVALIFFWICKRDKPLVNESVPKQSKASASEVKTASLIDGSTHDNTKQIETERSRYTKMMKLGFQSIPTRNKAGNLEISVEIKTPSAGCQIGEFDLIKNLSSKISAQNLLLTIEEHSQKGKALYKKELSILDIVKQNHFTIVLPEGSDLGVGYTINLCMNDSRGENCLSKRKLEPKDWQAEMNNPKAHDFLFYTQFFVIKSKVAWLIPTHRFDSNSLKSIESALKPILKDSEAFRNFSENLRLLSPMPAQVNQSKLLLNLPSRASGC